MNCPPSDPCALSKPFHVASQTIRTGQFAGTLAIKIAALG